MTVTSRTFRIFVSSTFSDMKEERNALQKNVFPKLRALCEKNGCRFQAIDLRWGVSQEAGFDQQAVPICLEEISRCQRVTPKPNFIILLGNRYGWRPLPAEIPATEYEMLKGKIANPDENILLEKWYKRDNNAVPAVYCLQPRITAKDRNQKTWETIEEVLHHALKNAVSQCSLTSDALLKYETSATEQEIIHGALQVPDARDHVFGFFRDIEDLPSDANARDFIDLDANAEQIEEDRKASTRLRETVRNALGDNHVITYPSTWSGNGITYDHLPKFSDDVYSSLETVILGQIENLGKEDELDTEIASHNIFGNERAKYFVGRENLLQNISEYLGNEDPHPLALCGESGSGKTAFMARVVKEARELYPDAVIVSRFIGATASSTSIQLLLESLCSQIASGYSVDTSDIPKEYQKLVTEFPAKMRLAHPEKPLIIILDALDQLSAIEQGNRLSWLPITLPKNVKIIVSVIPGEDLTTLERMLPASNTKKIEPLITDEGKSLLECWLKDANRTLQQWQRDEIISGFSRNGLPLYLKLAFEEARRWKSYTQECRLSDTIPGIIQDNLLKRLSSETNHGPKIVSWSLGYLAASRYGLAEDELIDLISHDDSEVFKEFKRRAFSVEHNIQQLPVILWSRLYFDLEPYLMERNVHGVTFINVLPSSAGRNDPTPIHQPKREDVACQPC